MTIKELREIIIESRKNGDVVVRTAFEGVLAKALIEEKSGKYSNEVPEDIIASLIKKEIKELRESASYFVDQTDARYLDIEARISILTPFLPAEMSEEQVIEIIREIIAAGETNKGKIIGAVCKKVGSSFEKSKVAGLVNKILN